MKAEWVKTSKQLPEDGQMCDIKLKLPQGYHYNMSPDWMKRMDERNGVAEKQKLEIDEATYENKKFGYIVNHKENEMIKELLNGGKNYYWSGLRIDMPQFVTHWRPSKDD